MRPSWQDMLPFGSGGAGAKIFFVDEAHFRADAELRGRRVLRGGPALVDSGGPTICAWEPGRQYRNGSGTSCRVWLTGRTR